MCDRAVPFGFGFLRCPSVTGRGMIDEERREMRTRPFLVNSPTLRCCGGRKPQRTLVGLLRARGEHMWHKMRERTCPAGRGEKR